MKSFQSEIQRRFKIPPSLVEKYKDDICFMVEIDVTCMEAMKPRVKFVEPICYEISEELIESYVKINLESDKDKECPRWGAFEEKMKEVHSELYSKDIKMKVDKKIEDILKESCMTRGEFNEVKGIALEIKASG